MTPAPRRLGAALAALALTGACASWPAASSAPGPGAAAAPAAPVADAAAFRPPPPGPSWAPAPVTRAGLRAVATVRGGRLALHTTHGDVGFWTGVDVGATVPGHSPGELAVSWEDYRRWFALMGRLGVRFVRVYAVHPPAFYQQLREHNSGHPDSPLYLVQGVALPDESYLTSGDLFAAGPTRAFTGELRAASAAVHGDLRRAPVPGRSSGTWTADVSPWLAGWLIGNELDPAATAASDRRNAAAPEHEGRFFASRADGTPTTPTERWLAARMDELAAAEAARGASAPVAFVNWPTTDPLRHPGEPLPEEDLLALDANHVRATAAWPGGTFASYHAYPYYPDFLRHQVDYRRSADPYEAYLADLRRHHAGLPVVVAEFGVPSSLGSAHAGTLGRDQGGHEERDALAVDAALLRAVHRAGTAGGFLFSWTDEWFKRTWNTTERSGVVDGERRTLWHDPLTNEQWFGLLAHDPLRAGWRTVAETAGTVRAVRVDHDASYAYVDVALAQPPSVPLRLGFDVVRGGLGLPGVRGPGPHDVAVVVDPAAAGARALVRGDLDPLLLDRQPAGAVPPPGADGWTLQRLSTSRAQPQRRLPAEFQDVGVLRHGTWDAGGSSLATWRLSGTTLSLRLPWSLLAIADPSSRTALVPRGGRGTGVAVDEIGLTVDPGAGAPVTGALRWEGWQSARYAERLKPGVQPLVDAMAQLGR